MNKLKLYPMTAVFLTFFIGSCVFAYISGLVKLVLLLFFAVMLILLLLIPNFLVDIFRDKSLRRVLSLILGALITSLTVSFVTYDIFSERIDGHSGEDDTVTLKVISCDYSLSYVSQYIAKVEDSENGIPYGTRIILRSPIGSLEEGDILSGKIMYSSLKEESSTSFDGRRYYLPKRIFIVAEDVSLVPCGNKFSFSITGMFDKLSSRLSSMILASVGRERGGIASAVLLGDKDYLDDSVVRDFRRIGISHLLVVSGTHFSVIVSFVENGMRRIRVNRRYRAMINLGLIAVLMGLTGFTPSVVRAGIMHMVAQLSYIVSKRADAVHSFSLAGALMLAVNPLLATDCGFQLSFIASCSCILYGRNRAKLYRFMRRKRNKDVKKVGRLSRFFMSLLGTFIMTGIVTLCTLPLMWLYFGEISVISIPANMAFIPLITLLMYLTGLHLLLYPIRIFIYPTGLMLSGMCDLIESLAEFFAGIDHAMIAVNYSFSILFLVPLTILLVCFPFMPKGKRWITFTASIAVCALFFGTIGIVRMIDSKNVYFSYVSEKKNDGFVISGKGKVLLCDISDGSSSFFYNLTDEMSNLHSCEIDAVLFTHYHNKHVQLLGKLCEREIVKEVILPEPLDERENGIYESILDTADYYGIVCSTYHLLREFAFENVDITFLDRKYLSRSTHPITAVKVEAYGKSIAIASCSFNQAAEVVAEEIEDADYIIFGRHSPVYKKSFELSLSENTKGIAISNDAYDYMTDVMRRSIIKHEVEWNPERWRIRITENTSKAYIE